MRTLPRCAVLSCAVLALMQMQPSTAADADFDPLSLESAPETSPETAANTKIFVEAALGSAALRRASIDLTHASRLAPHWRAVISDRIDHIDPASTDATVNSLREAYLSWQPDAGNTVLELGRINLRHGPAYGYNPTDFFRDGSLRTLTSSNPFAMRENRLGSVMLRAQRLWTGGSMSLAYSPQLADQSSTNGWSLDLGATNHRHRGLFELSTQLSPRINSQVLLYKEQGPSATVGASLSALLSDAAVAHAEWSRGSEVDPLARALAVPGAPVTRSRWVGGLTYTTLGKLSVTAEYQYNGFGASQQDWRALAANPMAQWSYLRNAQHQQELVSRQAMLIYITQKSLFRNHLDLTAFLRVNLEDQSRLTWLELRHHRPRFDLAVQWQQYSGSSGSEYGLVPERRVVQVLGNYYY